MSNTNEQTVSFEPDAWIVDFQDGGKNLIIEPAYYKQRGADFERGGAKLIPLYSSEKVQIAMRAVADIGSVELKIHDEVSK